MLSRMRSDPFSLLAQSLSMIDCRLRGLSNLTHLTALEQASFRKNLIPRIEVRTFCFRPRRFRLR